MQEQVCLCVHIKEVEQHKIKIVYIAKTRGINRYMHIF